jgi:hypothetical protein
MFHVLSVTFHTDFPVILSAVENYCPRCRRTEHHTLFARYVNCLSGKKGRSRLFSYYVSLTAACEPVFYPFKIVMIPAVMIVYARYHAGRQSPCDAFIMIYYILADTNDLAMDTSSVILYFN